MPHFTISAKLTKFHILLFTLHFRLSVFVLSLLAHSYSMLWHFSNNSSMVAIIVLRAQARQGLPRGREPKKASVSRSLFVSQLYQLVWEISIASSYKTCPSNAAVANSILLRNTKRKLLKSEFLQLAIVFSSLSGLLKRHIASWCNTWVILQENKTGGISAYVFQAALHTVNFTSVCTSIIRISNAIIRQSTLPVSVGPHTHAKLSIGISTCRIRVLEHVLGKHYSSSMSVDFNYHSDSQAKRSWFHTIENAFKYLFY